MVLLSNISLAYDYSRVEKSSTIISERRQIKFSSRLVFTRVSGACFICLDEGDITLTSSGTCIMYRCNARVNNIKY